MVVRVGLVLRSLLLPVVVSSPWPVASSSSVAGLVLVELLLVLVGLRLVLVELLLEAAAGLEAASLALEAWLWPVASWLLVSSVAKF
jgi:hypothetical protein